jgi:hypothetical protein
MSNQSKYEIVNVKDVDVTVDVSLLQKTDDLFFNATEIAKQFGKKPDDFLRLESTKEYINEIMQDSQVGNSRLENLVRITHGGKYRGTWLHKELAFEFFGWCSAAFRRAMHKWVEQRLNDEQQLKQVRLKLKTGFAPLTNAIQSAHKEVKPHHFIIECNLINQLVTGMDAKTFKEKYGVQSVRDALTAAQALLMEKLQTQDTCLIELDFDYPTRKQKLSDFANQFFEGSAAIGVSNHA